MGLPGSGKSYLAERLQKHLDCAWYNADEMRKMANDWDFSLEARLRQSYRMKSIADMEHNYNRIVICDFVAPLSEMRQIFNAHITIWVDTITDSRFEDTNKMFIKPDKYDYRIENHLSDIEIKDLANVIKCS